MKKEIKRRRIDLSNQIAALEKHRCPECSGWEINPKAIKCECPAAVEIRGLGEQLIAISARIRQERIDESIRQARKSGMTMKIYRMLREHEFTNLDIQKASGMTRAEYNQWRIQEGLAKPPATPVKKASTPTAPTAAVAIERGLTLTDYLNARKLGYVDREIREKYNISHRSMLNFKKYHGLALPRGHHTKTEHRGVKQA